jgi:hypothetical protein
MAGKKEKKPKQPKNKKHPPNRLRALMCLVGKYPQGNTLVSVPTPDAAENPLASRFPTPAPAAGQYPLGTASFRSWVAVEALRRGPFS